MKTVSSFGVALLLAGCAQGLPFPLPLRPAEQTPARPPVGATALELLRYHEAAASARSAGALTANNAVELLVDGPASYAAMFDAIRHARRSIHLQTYIFEADDLGKRMAALLAQKRSAGVSVDVIYDAVGSIDTPDAFFDDLRGRGINICAFNPLNPLASSEFAPNHRSHRKILVVDGVIAFTGGVNISGVYSVGSGRPRSGESEKSRFGWRDTQVAIRGPAVAEFERLFAGAWARQDCRGGGTFSLPAVAAVPAGDKRVWVIAGAPEQTDNRVYVELLSALRSAARRIDITMAYFVPDEQTIDVLCDAARRGVDVRLMLPGFTDVSIVFHAGRSYYDRLLDAGVRIYERKDALLHAKTVAIDGVWSMVGSANMDWRSFVHNDEVTVVVLGTQFGTRMTAMFERDVERATRIDPQRWAERGVISRLKEAWARWFEYWL